MDSGGGHALFSLACGGQYPGEHHAPPYNHAEMSRSGFLAAVLIFAGLLVLASLQLRSQTPPPTPGTQQRVPVMDGDAGPCSLELTVNGIDGKPAYAATIKVHIAYGFAGIRRLDLEAGTNSEGKVKFTGLPARVHRPPLEFNASKDDLSGTATYDPSAECAAKHDIALTKPKNPIGCINAKPGTQ